MNCPGCGGTRIVKAGIRYLEEWSEVQRYLCKDCGLRFSHSVAKRYKMSRFSDPKATAVFRELKEAGSEECTLLHPVQNVWAGDISQQIQSSKGKLVEYALWMQKQGYAEATITRRIRLFGTLVKRGVNFLDVESVKEGIARQKNWSPKTKALAVDGYTNFLKMLGQTWIPPHYKPIRKLPFIPLEREIDDLIAACNPKTAAFLRLLKETGARLGSMAT